MDGFLTYLRIVPDSDGVDGFAWPDPKYIIILISGLQELLFRAAIAASKSTSSQTIIANEEPQQTIYISHCEYLAIAVGSLFTTIIMTSVNLRGWWHFGRTFTLGPFKIAKAFNAPFIADVAYLDTLSETKYLRGVRHHP
ncbi:hypothetical protein DID88_008666 [Monilinia fructigena]|uniref:Uncharacterized protein n=1 Tax=Monilinia fructigena TaxID=38457 RepID=A0A395J614_9HELO|nr:hypothetical protein DID88_008666 [Monilinia fructigena]